MNKIKYFIVLIFLSGSLMAQSDKGKNILKISPFTFPKGQILMVHYERQISNQFTVA